MFQGSLAAFLLVLLTLLFVHFLHLLIRELRFLAYDYVAVNWLDNGGLTEEGEFWPMIAIPE
jgi:hypothetical protein